MQANDVSVPQTTTRTDGERQTTTTVSSLSRRNWCFTLNNPTDNINFTDVPNVRYAVYQRERGEQGTEHFQGYLELRKPARMSAMRKLIPGAHFEVRRGTRDQAREYCLKQDTRIDGPFEFGDWTCEPGKRTDLLEIKRMVDGGQDPKAIWDEHFGSMLRYHKSVDVYRGLTVRGRDPGEPPSVWVIYGPPGTGKSKLANERVPNAYWMSPGEWFDGYQPGQSIILDDYRGWLTWTVLLRLCDRYPFRGQFKGGFVHIDAPMIVFTTNKEPRLWYKKEDNWPAFERRVTRWFYKKHLDIREEEFEDYPTFWSAVIKG